MHFVFSIQFVSTMDHFMVHSLDCLPRLQFETTSKHTFAHVKHCTNDIVVSASTKELAIAKHLYRWAFYLCMIWLWILWLINYCVTYLVLSNTDISAAENIGRVLARRCLECGVTTMSLHDSMHGNSQRVRFSISPPHFAVYIMPLNHSHSETSPKILSIVFC